MKGIKIAENKEFEVYQYGDVYRVSYYSDRVSGPNKTFKSRVTKNKAFVDALISDC